MAEAWLSGKMDGYSLTMMPAAHALVQAIKELRNFTDLTTEELLAKPNAASIAFHLRHLAGSCDRLLTYAKGDALVESQFEFLKKESVETSELNADELVQRAIFSIEKVLEFCRNVAPETLFEARFVGRQRLETNVFGLLFHIAEHTARHVGQIVTTAKVVAK